eukprot:TRINITY_DN69489_c0_g1_i1.p1 TRINITY_DN69489_c0_g1~~TRINITY_DN69489_c0_g1_i1.p1  ORF type:complete len:275 (-),score=5.77 TRINITY_DN69489_c0_g1_i1:75-899(-)
MYYLSCIEFLDQDSGAKEPNDPYHHPNSTSGLSPERRRRNLTLHLKPPPKKTGLLGGITPTISSVPHTLSHTPKTTKRRVAEDAQITTIPASVTGNWVRLAPKSDSPYSLSGTIMGLVMAEREKEKVRRGLKRMKTCGLCLQDFEANKLKGWISNKSILELRHSWGMKIKTNGVMPHPAHLYKQIPLCIFCCQFFSIYELHFDEKPKQRPQSAPAQRLRNAQPTSVRPNSAHLCGNSRAMVTSSLDSPSSGGSVGVVRRRRLLAASLASSSNED